MGGTRRSARQLTRCVDEGQGTMVVEGGRRPALWSQAMAEAWREALSDARQPHAAAWTDRDPGLPLAGPSAVTGASMRRRIWRALSGRTGWKRLKATLRRDLGLSRGRVKRNFEAGLDALGGVVV